MPTDYSFDFVEPTVVTAATTSTASEVTRALRVDPTTGDVIHDGRRLQLVSGLEAVAQALRTRLGFFQGEHFLDESFGTPWFQTILGKEAPVLAVREVFRKIITETVGVRTVDTLELTRVSGRDFELTFTVTTDLNEFLTLTIPVGV